MMTANSLPHIDQPPTIDSRRFRDALGQFVTGVTLVTARAGTADRVGVTVNSFTSVSLDPPLVLFCLGRQAQSLPVILSARSFAVNILGRDQQAIAERFALDSRSWAGLGTESWETGAPILRDVPAALDCRLHATHDGGDHVIVIGRVVGLGTTEDAAPLGYHRGRYVTVDRRNLNGSGD